MIARVLEAIAPHDTEDGPDTRGFWERAADADMSRAENYSTIWTTWKPRTPRTYWQLDYCWQVTRWGIGIDYEAERPSINSEGRRSLALSLGPCVWSLSRYAPQLPRLGGTRL